jgi:hypothetical protein
VTHFELGRVKIEEDEEQRGEEDSELQRKKMKTKVENDCSAGGMGNMLDC